VTGEHGGRKILGHERTEHFRKRLVNLLLPTRARAVELNDIGPVFEKIAMPAAAEQ
jgi:hypothetical protein